MLSKRILFNNSKVYTLKSIRTSANTPGPANRCPKPPSSPEIVNKKLIESRYEECQQLLRIKKVQKGYQTVKGVFKGDLQGMTFSDVKSLMNVSYLKTLVIYNTFILLNIIHFDILYLPVTGIMDQIRPIKRV